MARVLWSFIIPSVGQIPLHSALTITCLESANRMNGEGYSGRGKLILQHVVDLNLYLFVTNGLMIRERSLEGLLCEFMATHIPTKRIPSF